MTQIKKHAKKANNAKIIKNTTQISFFYKIAKKIKMKTLAFYVIAFEPIKIQTLKMTV